MKKSFAQVLKESSKNPGSTNNENSMIDISTKDKPECEMETKKSSVQDNVLGEENTVTQEQIKQPGGSMEQSLDTFKANNDYPPTTYSTTETSNPAKETSNTDGFISFPSAFPDMSTTRSFTSRKHHMHSNYESPETSSSSSSYSLSSTDDENNKSTMKRLKKEKEFTKETLPIIIDSPVKYTMTSEKKKLPSKIPQPTKKFRSLTISRVNQADKILQKNQQTQTEETMNISSEFNAKPSASNCITLDTSQSTMSQVTLKKIALLNNFIQSADASIDDLERITNLNTEHEEEICRSNSIPSISSGTSLQAEASTSGIYSGSSRSIGGESQSDARSSSISLDSCIFNGTDRVESNNMLLNDPVRNLKYILAGLAFRNLEECKVSLPQNMRKLNSKCEQYVPAKGRSTKFEKPRLRIEYEHAVEPGFEHFRRKNTYRTSGSGTERLERHWTINGRYGYALPNNVGSAIPRPIHTSVVIIEHIEKIFELLLSVGFKISKNTRDAFGSNEIPTAIHNAMSDVNTFLEPIKITLKTTVQGEYMRPFVDAVHDALKPFYNHLNDSVIALESPAVGKQHVWLKLDKPEPQVDIMQEIANLNQTYNVATNGSDFLTEMMNMYTFPPVSRTLTQRSGSNRALVHPLGLIVLQFLHDIQVVLTVDLGIIVFNKTNKKVVAISANGLMSGIKFRYGECMQRELLIDMSVRNPFHEIEKRARISPKGVTFQDERSSTTYLVTNSNISTCPGIYPVLPVNFLGEVFYSGSRYGPDVTSDCIDMLRFARNEYTEEGTLVWIIQNLQIKQNPDGQVILHKSNAEYTIVISPNRLEEFNSREELMHTARLTTPRMHVTCSVSANDHGSRYHYYVRHQTKKVFASELKFVVRNGNQTAGLNKEHRISLHPS